MIFLIPEIIILAISSFIICQSAWTGQFSFEYSFFLTSVVFAVVTISALVRKSQTNDYKDKLRNIGSYLTTLVIPLVIVLLYSLKYGLCSLKSGILWFALLPGITLLYSLGCATWAKNSQRTGWKLWLTCLMPTILLSILTLRDLYVDPQISFYHPVLGYFPGPVYDEWIPRFFFSVLVSSVDSFIFSLVSHRRFDSVEILENWFCFIYSTFISRYARLASFASLCSKISGITSRNCVRRYLFSTRNASSFNELCKTDRCGYL